MLNKGCEWKGLFMSLAGHLPQEEQGKARAGVERGGETGQGLS